MSEGVSSWRLRKESNIEKIRLHHKHLVDEGKELYASYVVQFIEQLHGRKYGTLEFDSTTAGAYLYEMFTYRGKMIQIVATPAVKHRKLIKLIVQYLKEHPDIRDLHNLEVVYTLQEEPKDENGGIV